MYKDFKFLFQKKPSYIIFWIEQLCNFTCEHCFNYLENKKKRNNLTLDEIEKISKNLDHLKYVTLAGGEPMIRNDVFDIIKIFHKNNGLQMLNIVTNGWFIEKIKNLANKVIKELPDLHINFGISIDGLEEKHDFIRQKKGSFKKCCETLNELKKISTENKNSKLTFNVNGVYTSENADSIIETSDFFIEKYQVPYTLCLVRGEDIQNNDYKKVDVDHYYKTYSQITDKNDKIFSKNYPYKRVRLAVEDVMTEINYNSAKLNKATLKCKAGQKGFVINSSGEMLLCELLNINLGNVRDFDFNPIKVLETHNSKNEIKKIQDENCHCTWECFQRMNVVHSPKIYPKIVSNLIKRL
tara:strand:+ start:4951 stop:6012 length:1062 start_codon:yes stop_codon:yes gene_type:complete